MSSQESHHSESNDTVNVDQPSSTVSTELPSNDQQQSEPQSEIRPDSPHKTSKRRPHKKPKKKAARKKSSSPPHLQVIRDQIDALKEQIRQAEAIAEKEAEQRTDEERAILDKKDANSASAEQLEELFAKLSTPEMIQKSQQQPQSQQQESSTKRGLTEEQTITMLHFFYLVRLSQQGFFSVIANAYPDLQVEALAYLCDKLVGNSLFLSTDAAAGVQKEKTKQVFDLLRKLHQGVDEPVGDDFTMTFKQVRDVMYNLVDKALQQPKMNGESSSLLPQPSPSEDSLQQQQQQQRRQQQSVWVVVPFTGMMDLTSIQLPSGTVPPPPPISADTITSTQNETTIDSSSNNKQVPDYTLASKSSEKDNTEQVNGEVVSEHEQSTEGTEEDGSSQIDGFHPRSRGRGRGGRGYNMRGFSRGGRGRGDGARGGGSFRGGGAGSSSYRGRGFFRGPGRGVSWSPPSASQ